MQIKNAHSSTQTQSASSMSGTSQTLEKINAVTQRDLYRLASKNLDKGTNYLKNPTIIIKLKNLKSIPAALSTALGKVDQTGYTRQTDTALLALQLKDDALDLYSPTLASFNTNYTKLKDCKSEDLKTLDGKLGPDSDATKNFILKHKPAYYVKGSASILIPTDQLGYADQDEVSFQTPWCAEQSQSKPAGAKGFIVCDTKMAEAYLVNADKNGNPANYIKA